MQPEIVFYAIGGICALVVALLGARGVRRQSGELASDADPNQQLIGIVERQGKQIDRLTADSDRSKVRMSDLERDLEFEKGRSDLHERRIGELDDENKELRTSLQTMQKIVDAWKSWHLQLVTAWHIVRQSEAPPDGPVMDGND